MAFDEALAVRIRTALGKRNVEFEEKKMMGGLCFLVDGKMCMGVVKDKLMARIGPDAYDEALKAKGCKEMDFTGRPMKGFVFVEAPGISGQDQLDHWIGLCLSYNPQARSAAKKN
ncbi:MAG: TfoX/Sxy family protein [Ignavibacteria bacterium]|nr:TfoX/Sxy family protein [Ignavibacteria bacterium]